MKYFRPISISLSPNVEKDDLRVALNLLVRPWLWKNGKGVEHLEQEFAKYLRVKHAVSFNSGRSAFYAILKAMEVKKGSKVLLQAFTCNAVPNPVLWNDLEPVYVDCNKDDFNIEIEDLKKKIAENPDAKILVVQHTFGLPANMQEVMYIVRQNGLNLIEDCAHSLGAEYGTQKTGTFGKAAFFSFGRDKVLSSVYGGMVTTNDDQLAEEIRKLQSEFGLPSLCWIFQQIIHPILLHYIVLPIYNFFDLGKLILIFSQVTHILSKAVSWKEKRGQRPDYFPKALPNALAMMAINQFSKLDKFNYQRKRVAQIYYDNLKETKFELPKQYDERKSIFLRFTVKHKDAHLILYDAWHKQNILLGDWYTTAIAPFDTKLEDMKYKMGMCPNTESLAKQTFNLPTHINMSAQDVARVVVFLKNYK